jgi:hypothetical protein
MLTIFNIRSLLLEKPFLYLLGGAEAEGQNGKM